MDTRSNTEAHSAEISVARASQDVYIPRWVNEPLPDLRAILSASEISRLTRRPRWLLLGLAVLGRFPKQRTHCGKPVGWHRADVLDWLTQNMTIEDARASEPRTCRSARPRQACLPLEANTPPPIPSAFHSAATRLEATDRDANLPHSSRRPGPTLPACSASTRAAKDRPACRHDNLRNGAARRIPAALLSDVQVRGVGSQRSGAVANCPSRSVP